MDDSLQRNIESTPFRCEILLCPERMAGLIRIEYEGHNEQEVTECDLKLISRIISFFETKGTGSLVLLPLEFETRRLNRQGSKEAA